MTARWVKIAKLVGPGLALGLGPVACTRENTNARGDQDVLTATRGDLQEKVLLTGVLDAARSVELPTPRTEGWSVAIRWMAEDGTVVKEGDPVVEFENAAVLQSISELEAAAIEASSELSTARASHAVGVAEKRFAVVTAQAAVKKAALDAALPEGLQSPREYRKANLELKRSQTAVVTARDDLQSETDGARSDEEIKRIAVSKAMRAYDAAAAQLSTLALKAPKAGIFQVGTQPFEGRKMQVGDNVWPGLSVASIPDLSAMVVNGSLSDVDDGRVQPGMRVRCTVDAFATRPFMGTVRAVSPVAHAADRKSQRRFFAVVVELDETDPAILRPGLSVKLEVHARLAQDVVIVPRAGVDRSEAIAMARGVDGRDIELKIDFCTAQSCVVSSGLDVGDKIVAAEGRR